MHIHMGVPLIHAKSKSLGKMTLEGVEVKWAKKGKVMGSKMAILHDIPKRNRFFGAQHYVYA